MRKTIVIFLAIFLVLSVSPVISFATDIVDSGTCGAFDDNLTWTLDSEGTLSINGTRNMNSYGVKKYNDIYVTSASWGQYYIQIKAVVIGDGVTSIGACSFYGCSNLTRVTIGNSVTSIGKDSFSFCRNLTSVTIPNSVTSIEGSAFWCSSLTSVTISDSMTSIGDHAFYGCSRLNDVYYTGKEEDWNKIIIGSNNNDTLINATKHFHHVHEIADITSIQPATCAVAGTKVGTCVCGYFMAEELPVLDHTPGEAVLENEVGATCKENGNYDEVVYCTECGDELSRTPHEIATLAHTPVTAGAYKASCIIDGFTGVTYCSVCDEVLNQGEIIPAAGTHNPGETLETVIVPATCGKDGVKQITVTCTACGEKLSETTEIIPATDEHISGAAEEAIVTDATCGKDGVKLITVKCTSCGKTLSETAVAIPATGEHTPDEPVETIVADATCGKDGVKLITTKCSVCGEPLSANAGVIPATGAHTPGEATETVVTAATCTAAGEKRIVVKCTVCGETLSDTTEEIFALKHQYTSVVTAPTCTEKGYTTYTCERGDSVYVSDYVDALGHTAPDQNGDCTRCRTHIQDVTQPEQPTQQDQPQQPKGDCKYCGQTHDGAFGWLVKFFHSILAIFKK